MKVSSSSLVLGVFAVVAILGFGLLQASDANFEIVKIKTESGSESSAAYFKGTNGQVTIFVPGAVFDKESWFFLAERLQKKQLASLSLDGKTPAVVLAAIKYLQGKGFKKIALVGGSMGGAAMLDALSQKTDTAINKVIALAPAGGNSIPSQKIKKLFIVAKHDGLGLYPDVKAMYQSSSEPKKFVEVDGSAHAQHLFKTSHKEELTKLIVDFIAD